MRAGSTASRLLHRAIAFLTRKFWTRCPRCRREFGGHQRYSLQIRVDGRPYRIVCRHCAAEAVEQWGNDEPRRIALQGTAGGTEEVGTETALAPPGSTSSLPGNRHTHGVGSGPRPGGQ